MNSFMISVFICVLVVYVVSPTNARNVAKVLNFKLLSNIKL